MTSEPTTLRLPIGISDFRKLREAGTLYVDKTDFVTQILATRSEVVLVPRPRRFGKTVNLSTLRYFVERSEEDRTALFEGLAVWGSARAREHFQRFPVIWMTFKDVKSGAFDVAMAAIRHEIMRAYEDHSYLLDKGALSADQTEAFRRILRAEGAPELYASSLRELSAYLGRYHKERVFILIDEYDTPIHAAASLGEEQRILDFFRAFLSGGLKDNVHLQKGVLTGILRIAKESLFSGLNNPVVYSLLRTECATCFGFTPEEVKDLAERTGSLASLPELEAWYNGYRFGGQVIYNPWSIVNFLDSQDKVCRPYWVNTSSDDLLRRVIFAHGMGRQGELETLIQGGEIRKHIDDRLALRDLGKNPASVWSFLLFTGYLKAVDVEEGIDTIATLSIPNREVLSVYRTIFRTWLEDRLGGSGQVEELLRAILSGDAEASERLFGDLLQSLSVYDLAARRASGTTRATGRVSSGRSDDFDPEAEVILTPEQIYHVFVVSLLLGLQPTYLVRSNRESGAGRYDVMVLPRSPGRPGVILELKVLDRRKRETMKSALAAALRQIKDRDYAAELRASGASPIHEMAIVFDGKQARVATAKPARATKAKTAHATKAKPARTTKAKPARATNAKTARTTKAKPARPTKAKPARPTKAKPARATKAKTARR